MMVLQYNVSSHLILHAPALIFCIGSYWCQEYQRHKINLQTAVQLFKTPARAVARRLKDIFGDFRDLKVQLVVICRYLISTLVSSKRYVLRYATYRCRTIRVHLYQRMFLKFRIKKICNIPLGYMSTCRMTVVVAQRFALPIASQAKGCKF